MSIHVIKKNGEKEVFDATRLHKALLRYPRNNHHVNITWLVSHISRRVADGMTTTQIEDLIANTCASQIASHPSWGEFGAKVLAHSWRKRLGESFVDAMSDLVSFERKGRKIEILDPVFVERVKQHQDQIQAALDFSYDDRFSVMGLRTLEKNYLLRGADGEIRELPQHMYMRVALGVCPHDIDMAIKTYHLLGSGKYSHATPTLFASGTRWPQLSSCFLMPWADDLGDMMDTVKAVSFNAKFAGGLAVDISMVRPEGSPISTSNRLSKGIVPALNVLSSVTSWIDQGGRRATNAAVYANDWHPEIMTLVNARVKNSEKEVRIKNVFPAIKISTQLMDRADRDDYWYFVDPSRHPDLLGTYDDFITGKMEFSDKYEKIIKEGTYMRKVKARALLDAIASAWRQSSVPYVMFNDNTNTVSMQKGIGIINLHNLCIEIPQVTSKNEHAVCVLAAAIMTAYVNADGSFDYDALGDTVRHITRVLDGVIDFQLYATPESAYGATHRRALGIGVMGMADALIKMGIPFQESGRTQRLILETMYYAFIDESTKLAQERGSFTGHELTPYAQGKLMQDMYADAFGYDVKKLESGRYNWDEMRERVKRGIRNSLGIALMPTASTSKIAGKTESFEPKVLAAEIETISGSFMALDQDLVQALEERGLWNESIRQQVILTGSVQGIPEIPDDLKKMFVNPFDMGAKQLVEMAVWRQPFVDQAQSMNLYSPRDGDTNDMLNAVVYGGRLGLRTGCYYFHQQPAADPNAALAFANNKADMICESCAV